MQGCNQKKRFLKESIEKFIEIKFSSKLLFKWDGRNLDFFSYFYNINNLVFVLRTTEDHVFGAYVEYIAEEKSDQNPKGFLFSITNEKCF